MESFFTDRVIFADLLTSYYTNFEPSSIWVAQQDQKVCGYIMGSLKPLRYFLINDLLLTPLIVLKGLFRGVFLKKETWTMILGGLKSICIGGLNRKLDIKSYPAHLHINIDKDFRGLNIGKKLINEFLKKAKDTGIPGIHLSTRGGNTGGRGFFRKMGFIVLGRYPMFMPANKSLRLSYSVIYGKKI